MEHELMALIYCVDGLYSCSVICRHEKETDEKQLENKDRPFGTSIISNEAELKLNFNVMYVRM